MEEIRDITWGLWGQELSHKQTIQRIINAGFPIKGGHALTMFAIVEGESGEYQKAWHSNVERNNDEDRTIKRYVQQPDLTYKPLPIGMEAELMFMKVKSIDLGFMQINKQVWEFVEMGAEAVEAFVNVQFAKHPGLDSPVTSCALAYQLWQARGFDPWYAWQPGTDKFRLKKRYGAKAFADWLIQSFVGPDPETGKLPQLVWKD